MKKIDCGQILTYHVDPSGRRELANLAYDYLNRRLYMHLPDVATQAEKVIQLEMLYEVAE
jgi:hypothetical protein